MAARSHTKAPHTGCKVLPYQLAGEGVDATEGVIEVVLVSLLERRQGRAVGASEDKSKVTQHARPFLCYNGTRAIDMKHASLNHPFPPPPGRQEAEVMERYTQTVPLGYLGQKVGLLPELLQQLRLHLQQQQQQQQRKVKGLDAEDTRNGGTSRNCVQNQPKLRLKSAPPLCT